MVDAKASLVRDRLGQRGHRMFIELFDGAAGSADQVVVMAWLAPDIGGNMAGPLEALRQACLDEHVHGAEDGRPPDVRMLPTNLLVQLLDGCLLPGSRQRLGDGQSLGREPLARTLQRRDCLSLRHTHMILAVRG